MIPLPEAAFNDVARDLHLFARNARHAADAGEVMAAREDTSPAGLNHAVLELRASASTAGQVYELFRALAPHEKEVRAFLAGLEQQEKAA